MIGELTNVDAYKIDGHCNSTTLTYLYLLFIFKYFKKFPKGIPVFRKTAPVFIILLIDIIKKKNTSFI